MTLVEAAVETLQSALAAERAGADRIELCTDLSDGGTTPSEGLMAAVAARTQIPVVVLIRPRAGGFVFSDDEIDAMSRDIEQLIDLGVSRVLTSGGAATALEGAPVIAALVDQARERIAIIAGGGIRAHNVRDVIARTGVREVHARLVDKVRMRNLVDVVSS